MIDLSFLTEEEQETILAVLKRDAELKKAEETRVKYLQRTVSNKGLLKYLTGEWFYETKALRHQDRIHGSDIIRASMRHKHKPLTILELSQTLTERPSFVSSGNQEVFVPPQLSGLIQEPHVQRSNDMCAGPLRFSCFSFACKPHAGINTYKPLPSYDHCISNATNLNQDHPKDSPVTQNAPVPVPVAKTSKAINRSQDAPDSSTVEVDESAGRQTNSAAPRGILKHMSSSSSTDSHCSWPDPHSPVSLDSPTQTSIAVDREAAGWIDRKQVRFCLAFGQSRVEWQHGKELGEHSLLDVDLITASEEENSTDLVNTGSTVAGTRRTLLKQRQVDLDEGDLSCERGANLPNQEAVPHQVPGDLCEHRLTELLSPPASTPVWTEQESGKPVHLETEPEEDGLSKAETTDWLPGHSVHQPPPKLPEQSGDNLDISVETTSDTKLSRNGSSKNSSHAVSPKPRKGLRGIFSRGESKEKTAALPSPYKEEVMLSKQKEPDDTLNLRSAQSAANITKDDQINIASVQEEAQTPETTEFRTLQLTALQNNPFTETLTSLASGVDTQQEPTEDRDAKFPRRLSNLKAFWERGNSDPKVIFTRDQARHEDRPKTDTDDLRRPQNVQIDSTLDSKAHNFSPQTELKEECRTEDNVARSREEIPSSQIESSILFDLPEEEGTYRADPILICEETDDSLTGSITDCPIPEPQENVRTPLPISLSCSVPQQKGNRPVPHPRQENRPIGINDLKCEIELPQGRLSPSRAQTPRSKDSTEDDVRRSPSKTCHPKALPREPSSPKGSSLEGSPLKTFPIDIAPANKAHEEQPGRPTPAARPRKSPSHEAKPSGSMDVTPSTEIISRPLPLQPEDHLTSSPSADPAQSLTHSARGRKCGNINTQQSSLSSSAGLQSRKTSESGPALTKGDSDEQKPPGSSKKSGTLTHLARSFIPRDYQHYLGAAEKTHRPPFDQENAGEVSAPAPTLRPQSPVRDSEGNQGDRISSWIVQNTDSDSSHDRTTEALSQSRASSGTPPSASSHLDSEQMKKMSVSQPVFQQEELDSDTSENMDWKRNTGSSMSNISISSGMASMSSVSGSISSIYHADFGDIEVQGTIQFAVNYVQKLGEFHIFVVHCRDLAVAEPKKNRSDPYVKCYLVPDKTKLGKRKTIVRKKTLNPTYNEILRFKIIMEVLKTQKLNISVWHNHTFGRNSFLGEVDLDLSEWDFSNTEMNDFALKARVPGPIAASSPSSSVDTSGQMRVALRFLPQMAHSKKSKMETGEVQIWVKDCKNLPPVRGVIIDPFVKCTVLPDTSRKSRQKTRVVKRTANPMFNHTMVYDGFRPEDVKEACVELTVWDHDRLNNHYIGGLRLGLGTGKSYGAEVAWMDSTTDEASLWERMMQSHAEWVEDVLPLRMLLMAKSMSK
ncbi:uncharacterized protein sytl2a [Diretmus argenteus]